MSILDSMLADIKAQKEISQIYISDFHLCSPFAVVRLSDGSIGSAGNYDVQNHTIDYEPARIQKKYQALIKVDPLLVSSLAQPKSYAELAFRVAILSALSQSLLTKGKLSRVGLVCHSYPDSQDVLESLLECGDDVTLVGFGGGLEVFCTSKKIRRLAIYDFIFKQRKYANSAWSKIKSLTPDTSRISLIGDLPARNHEVNSDIFYLTGSSLCNGTIETLLVQAGQCREVIVQGPSSSVFPLELFRRGITRLLTNKKSEKEFRLGRRSDDMIYDVVDSDKIAIFKS